MGKSGMDLGFSRKLGRKARFKGLVMDTNMSYGCPIEFRPDDLASPRATRRTDDLLPISITLSRPRYCAAYLNTY